MTDDLIRRLRDVVRSGIAHKGEDYALFHQIKEAADEILFLREELDRLRAERDALREDAERIEYIIKHHARSDPDMSGNHYWHMGRGIGRGRTFRDAIDAARKGE